MDSVKTVIERFYSGEIPDNRGRFLSEIQAWDQSLLESVHDYIQWLFPLPEPSPVNPSAPLIVGGTIAAFAASPELRGRLLTSFLVMMEFYGFAVEPGPPLRIVARLAPEKMRWLGPGDHNLLRITRILRSTRLLGNNGASQALFAALEQLYAHPRGEQAIGPVSFRYWREAALS